MPMTTISVTLSSIKGAIDIGSFILKSSDALDRAILQVKIEEMVDSLSSAKKTIRELEELIYEKDKNLARLQEQLSESPSNVGYLGARYLIGENGEPTGTAHCPTCWGSKKQLIPLSAWSVNEATHKCGECGNTIQDRMSPLNVDYYIQKNREVSLKINVPFSIETYK